MTHPDISTARETLWRLFQEADSAATPDSLAALAHNMAALIAELDNIARHTSSIFLPEALRCDCAECQAMCSAPDTLRQGSESLAAYLR